MKTQFICLAISVFLTTLVAERDEDEYDEQRSKLKPTSQDDELKAMSIAHHAGTTPSLKACKKNWESGRESPEVVIECVDGVINDCKKTACVSDAEEAQKYKKQFEELVKDNKKIKALGELKSEMAGLQCCCDQEARCVFGFTECSEETEKCRIQRSLKMFVTGQFMGLSLSRKFGILDVKGSWGPIGAYDINTQGTECFGKYPIPTKEGEFEKTERLEDGYWCRRGDPAERVSSSKQCEEKIQEMYRQGDKLRADHYMYAMKAEWVNNPNQAMFWSKTDCVLCEERKTSQGGNEYTVLKDDTVFKETPASVGCSDIKDQAMQYLEDAYNKLLVDYEKSELKLLCGGLREDIDPMKEGCEMRHCKAVKEREKKEACRKKCDVWRKCMNANEHRLSYNTDRVGKLEEKTIEKEYKGKDGKKKIEYISPLEEERQPWTKQVRKRQQVRESLLQQTEAQLLQRK